MHSILNKNLFFVKEHVGMFKAANNFDIFDPDNQQMIMTCREENLNFFTKMFRFTGYKRMTPFNIEIKTMKGEKVLTVKRGVPFIISKVDVYDEKDQLIGKFKQKIFTIGGKFDILDVNDQVLCTLKGKWTSWDFRFLKDTIEYAHVSKKWAGVGKELFTSADNYMLKIDERTPADSPIRILILASVMCIDMVLKE